MSTGKFLYLTVIAGLGLSACSHAPKNVSDTTTALQTAIIPEAGALGTGTPGTAFNNNVRAARPLTQQVRRQTANQQVAKALDLSYGSPQASIAAAAPIYPQIQQPAPIQRFAPQPAIQRQQLAARMRMPQQQHRAPSNGSHMPSLSQAELRAIGQQIFENEGGGNMKRLVHWNVGEDFAAMGIGHFTWYPAGRRQRFGNTFPGLLDYMSGRGVQLPGWLQQARHTGSPWRSRSDFLSQRNSPQVRQLQQLLYNTRDIQAEYIVNRARRAMPRLVKASSSHMQGRVAQNLNAVANTPGGWYALIDYVNFKGEGLGNGGYKGQNWGLRQVLEEMRPSRPGQQALNEFADAAMRVLHRRVRNSDPRRNEARWLRGWDNRVNTYRRPIV